MNLYKRAAARGVCHELAKAGLVSFLSKQAADEAADAVADKMPEDEGAPPPGPEAGPPPMPEMTPETGHGEDVIVSIANQLMDLSQQLLAAAGGPPPGAMGPGGPGGPPPELPPELGKAAAYYQKTAGAADYETISHDTAVELMTKAAEETKWASALIEGGDKGNKPDQATATSEVAALDNKQRPQGTYQVPVGDTALDTNKGQLGSSESHDKTPKESPAGSNSLTVDAYKASALQANLRKMGSALMKGGDKGNTPQQAARTNEVAALDNKQRAPGKYKVPPGGANFSEPASARIGEERKPDVTPSRTVSGSNSVIAASKAASEAEEAVAFLTLFRKCASDVAAYLPKQLSQDEKVAAITTMIGFDNEGRQAYLDGLYKVAGDVTDMVAAMKDDKGKEKCSKCDKVECSCDGKKESALMTSLRQIATEAAKQ